MALIESHYGFKSFPGHDEILNKDVLMAHGGSETIDLGSGLTGIDTRPHQVLVMPSSGDDAGLWKDGSGEIKVLYLSDTQIKIVNLSSTNAPKGSVKLIIHT